MSIKIVLYFLHYFERLCGKNVVEKSTNFEAKNRANNKNNKVAQNAARTRKIRSQNTKNI